MADPLIDTIQREHRLPDSFRATVEDLYRPLAGRIASAARGRDTPLVVGLCGPQGSGKSTMAAVLGALLQAQGLAVAVLSLDDLYLTRAERLRLGETVHPLLRVRGVPGTHDVALGIQLLEALARPGATAIPAFDKAADDRGPPEQWPVVEGPVDVILFEGWCVGARPQSPEQLGAPINDLERVEDADGRWRVFVNAALAGPYQQLFAAIDLLILLEAPGFDAIHGWRLEQERKLRDRAGDGQHVMSDDEVRRFISHYERLTRHILTEMPARADILISLAADRSVLRRRW